MRLIAIFAVVFFVSSCAFAEDTEWEAKGLSRSLHFILNEEWNFDPKLKLHCSTERLKEIEALIRKGLSEEVEISVIQNINDPVGSDRGERKLFNLEKDSFETIRWKTFPEFLLYVGFSEENDSKIVFLNTINNPYKGVLFFFAEGSVNEIKWVMQWPPLTENWPEPEKDSKKASDLN